MSTLRIFWMVVPRGLDVLCSANEPYVNNDSLPVGYIAAYPTLAEFLQGAELVGDCCSFSGIGRRKVVVATADGVDIIHPWADQAMDCVFIKPLSVMNSTPFVDWLQNLAESGNVSFREDAASLLEDIRISIDDPMD
ncbi:MAG: hypothetical protein KAH31_09625 [Candidatus Sabulitectum sp.]|nr:hypothetical protein [Candidatus Sabulitectum sp.]